MDASGRYIYGGSFPSALSSPLMAMRVAPGRALRRVRRAGWRRWLTACEAALTSALAAPPMAMSRADLYGRRLSLRDLLIFVFGGCEAHPLSSMVALTSSSWATS